LIKRLLIALCLLLVLLLLLPMAMLQISPVSRKVGSLLSSQASMKSGLEIQIDEVKLYLPFYFALKGVSIERKEAPLLTTDQINVAWSPLSLLRKKLLFPAVKSSQVRLWSKESEKAPGALLVAWPELPIPLEIRSIEINEIVREDGTRWQLKQGSLKIEPNGGDFSAAAAVRSLDEERLHLSFSIEGSSETEKILLTVEGGKPAGLSPLPEIAIHNLSAWVEGGLADWQRLSVRGQLVGSVGVEPAFSLAYDLIGEESQIEASFQVVSGRAIDLIVGRVANQTGRVTLSGQISKERLSGQFSGEIFELSKLYSLDPVDLVGSLSFQGTVSGSIRQPSLEVHFSSPLVHVEQVPVHSLSGRLQLARGRGLWAGGVSLEGLPSTFPLWLSSDFSQESDGCWSLKTIHLKGEAVELGGHLHLCPQRQFSSGELRGQVRSFIPWSRPASSELAGCAAVEIKLTPFTPEQPQTLSAQVSLCNIQWNNFEASSVKGQLFLQNPLIGLPSGQIRLEGENITRGALNLNRAELAIFPSMGRWKFKGKAIGEPMLDFEGAWVRAPHLTTLAFDRLVGRACGRPIELIEPVTVSWSPHQSLFVSPLHLKTGNGEIEAVAALTKDESEVKLKLSHFPLALLVWLDPRLDLLGEANGQFSFEGDAGSTDGQASLYWEGLQLRGRSLPLTGSLHGLLTDNSLQLELESSSSREACPVNLSLNLPLSLTLSPVSAKVLTDQPLSAAARYKGAIGPWLRTFLFRDALITGQLNVDLGATGSLDQIELVGEAIGQEITYENINTGTRLQRVTALIAGKGDQFILQRLSGCDEQGGSIRGEGWLLVAPEESYPFEISVALDRTHLIQLDEAQAALSGNLIVSGTPTHPRASGDLTVVDAHLEIPKRLPACVPSLPVTYVNVPQVSMAEEEIYEPLQSPLFALDFSLHLPNTLKLSGRGLDSCWKGDLDITGTTEDLEVYGRLDLVQGKFCFSTRSFQLVKGAIGFDGLLEEATSIELVGSLCTEGIEVLASLTGSLSNPCLCLHSVPPLSQREILAYVLFNTPIDELSPFQAVQLAAVVNELCGGALIPNPIETLRRTLCLDHICIVRPDISTDEVGIEAGRHLGSHAYITFYRSIREQYNHMLVELDLREQYQVYAESQDDQGQTFGLRWKKDY
jgi:autotransporter translocation and assembly factor TamB